MSAPEAMQPRQFGPGGKYTTKFVGPRHVEAVHTGSGRRIGAMNWFATPLTTPQESFRSKAGLPVEEGRPTIYKAVVSAPMRRKGVATAMLAHARDAEPGLQHSAALSEDGAAWARSRP